LKDRIGSEIRTHFPANLEEGMAITRQEAWVERQSDLPLNIPLFLTEIVENVACAARKDSRIDKQSSLSRQLPITCLENTVSNAERRSCMHREKHVVPRIGDVHAAIPSLTGKFELEYEGELRGADNIARELIRAAVGESSERCSEGRGYQRIIDWFELGGSLRLHTDASTGDCLGQFRRIQGLLEESADLPGPGPHLP
jgi:magnesium chelatase subunit I